jgi:cell wall-associated NlpC family hydrolase
MARKHSSSTEVELSSAPQKKKASHAGGYVRAAIAGAFAVSLIGVGTMPAYAASAMDDEMSFALRTQTASELSGSNIKSLSNGNGQSLKAADPDTALKTASGSEAGEAAENSKVELKPEPKPEPKEEDDADDNDAQAEDEGDNDDKSADLPDVPSGAHSEALAKAAMNQLGVSQDCTDAVQNALAEIGLTTRRDEGGYDYGPMSFGEFGKQISPSQARAGDIMMRGGHVAIYMGDGKNHKAVHGGWPGSGGETTAFDSSDAWSSPSAYAVIIRVS